MTRLPPLAGRIAQGCVVLVVGLALDARAVDPPAPVSVGATGDTTSVARAPEIVPGRVYSLPELIDIAQLRNPLTRVAWEQARQAALAEGMVAATFLPFISASVIGGRQQYTATPSIGSVSAAPIDGTVSGAWPQLALQWLLFDFGKRDADRDIARHNAAAAGMLFNGVHQRIVYDVTRAYYLYDAARSRVRIAEQSLADSRQIEDAALARARQGVATSVAVAQARQMVAQARFGLVQGEGAERDAYQGLLAAIGVGPMTALEVQPEAERRLPDGIAPTEQTIATALAQRPDVLASASALEASRASIKAAQADYMPKVFLSASIGSLSTNFGFNGAPNIGQQFSGNSVLLGVLLPLYDGGLRSTRAQQAQSLVAESEAVFEKTKDGAAREIVVSANVLRSALASYHAASALVEAAAVTYDAALESYRHGVADISAASAAHDGLLAARRAQVDAYAASLVGAANVAFVLGTMTSADAPAALRSAK